MDHAVEKRGKQAAPRSKPRNKQARMEKDAKYNRQERSRPNKECLLSERKEHGLIAVSELQIRTYVAVAYATRFDSPEEDEWDDLAITLAEELCCDKRTVLSVFERMAMTANIGDTVNRKCGAGRPHKLDQDNPGLAAVALGLNSNFSLSLATEICNQTNEKLGIGPVDSSTVIRNLRQYTLVCRHRVQRRKTGSRDEHSDWAKARVARVKMTQHMIDLGKLFDAGAITMVDCKQQDVPPLWLAGTVFCDQSHKRAVPIGGNGHNGSTSRHQWRVAIDENTGRLDKNGHLPRRVSQIVPKFDTEARGCYAMCLVEDEEGNEVPMWLKTFNYTGMKLVSVEKADKMDKDEDDRVRKCKGVWSPYTGTHPYFQRFGKADEKNDLEILQNSTNWEELYHVTQHEWYMHRRKATHVASIRDFILHLIATSSHAYKGTPRENTFMLWHDRLSILWDTTTQGWLKSIKCPIEGWDNRTWADRFVRLRGVYNEGMTPYYKDSLPGNSPKLMPLDSHLFSDIKEGVARNVAFPFYLPDDDKNKYSLQTPRHVFESIERTIRNGCPSKERIIRDIHKIPETMKKIKEANGTYIDDNTSRCRPRHGVRLEAQKEQRLKLIDPAVQAKFQVILEDMLPGGGVPFKKGDEDNLSSLVDEE